MAAPSDRDHHEGLLDAALELARAAGEEILPRFRTAAVHRKADGTEVTEADRAAERRLRELIADRFPEHAVLGEEYGESGPEDARHRWIVDPLDGTAAFTLGLPTFGTLVAVTDRTEGEEPVVGVIHMPVLEETVYAARGLGCWFRAGGGDPVRVTVDPAERLEEAAVSATGPHSSDIQAGEGETPYRLTALVRRAGKFRFVGDCLQHALVCRGRLHVAVDTVMSPWDVAALVPCVEEAGGAVATVDGRRDGIVHGGSLVSASTEGLLRKTVEVLRP